MFDIDRLRRASQAVFLATEKEVADDLSIQMNDAAREIERLRAMLEEREGQRKFLDDVLRRKDEAMRILFERLSAAGVDCSDLFS